MGHYLRQRLLHLIIVFFGATFLIYAMVFLMPGDPINALGGDRGLAPEVAARIRAEYNLDQPFIIQYFLYVKNILMLNFGKSFSGVPVSELLGNAFPVTIKLTAMALTFEMLLGITCGVFCGIRRGQLFDSTFLVLSLVIIAIPTFVVGFVGQFLFGIKWRLLPTTVGDDVSFYSLLMPAIVLGALSFAYVLRLTRQSISENLNADHVRLAKAKGLSNRRVMMVHVLRNSLIPVVTFLGADIAALMSGAIVTEGIFAINGVGGTLYQSILKGESALIVTLTTILVIIYILANLLVDLLYAFLDPRICYDK